jgi:hypothetical protein
LPYTSAQYLLAVEQRLGSRTRFRIEAASRQNTDSNDLYTLNPRIWIASIVALSKDYSRGVHFLFQCRSENCLSGWIGYALVYARENFNGVNLPQFPMSGILGSPYGATFADQRHTVNLLASYRLTPTIRHGVKNVFSSGFPVLPDPGRNFPLGHYERLDLQINKSWQFSKCELGLYGELLNTTYQYNPIFEGLSVGPNGATVGPLSSPGVPIAPTVAVAFDF